MSAEESQEIVSKAVNSKWIELAHEKRGHIYPTLIYWLSAQHICKELGIKDRVTGCWYKEHEFSYLVTEGSFSKAGREILKRLKQDKVFLQKIIEANEKGIPKMLEAAESLSGEQIKDLSGERLFKGWQNWLDSFLHLMTWSGMGTVLEMEEPLLSEELERLLVKKLGKDNPKVGEYFQVLTTSTESTIAQKEEEALLDIRLKQLGKADVSNDIAGHVKKYSWIAFGYDGPGWTSKDIEAHLDDLSKEESEIRKALDERTHFGKKLLQQQASIEKELGLTEEERYLFLVLRTFGFWKFERKFLNQKGHHLMEDFIKELARRNSLSLGQAKMISPKEMKAALLQGKVDANLLDERINESVVVFYGLDYVVLSGEKARPVVQRIEECLKVDPNIRELRGSTAFPGFAKGIVKHVDSPEEMGKMNQGDILVSASTSPNILPAMKKAAAIITDSGGITCHAAIIAREIRTPALVGTKIATKVLKEGALVEVDTSKGFVKVLEQPQKSASSQSGKKWFIWEKIRKIHPMQNLDLLSYISVMPEPGLPIASGVKYENRNVELLANEAEFEDSGKRIAEHIFSKPQWLSDYLKAMDKLTAKYIETSKKILETDLASKSNAELSSLFRELHDSYLTSHKSGVLSIPSEFRHEFISKGALDLLEKRLKEKKLGIDLGSAFAILSQPEKESILSEERRDFLKLLDRLLSDKEVKALFKENKPEEIDKKLPAVSNEFDSKLSEHWKKYSWIFFMYEGPGLERIYFVKQLKENLGKAMYLAMEEEKNKKLLATQAKLVGSVSLNQSNRIIFSFPRRLVETKAYRKDAMYLGSFVFDILCREIGKRLGISVDQVRYMTRQELFDALAGKFKDFKLLDERIKYSVFYAVNGKTKFLVGEEARKWYKENVKLEEISLVDELSGTPAFRGIVTGCVKIINHPNEMPKMQEGNILVSHSTNPNLLPAMTKAAAIVTDVGGITCHAAIVSREFKIPCVVGTSVATQVLKDNDVVEVDAEKGIVRKKQP